MWNANSQREVEQVRQFVSLTGADEGTARRFLMEAVWNVEAALAAYHASEASPTAHQRQGIPRPARGALSRPQTGGVVTMNDLKRGGKQEAGQRYYAGGHSSGIQVQAPARPQQQDVDRLVNSVFSSAASNAEEAQPQRQWGGGGRRLGDADADDGTAAQAPTAQQEPCRITFWKNGFTVDDGPLRAYAEPRNEEFLRAINQGAVPEELRQRTAGGELGVQLVDRKTQERPTPRAAARAQPFACAGRRLGTDADATAAAHDDSGGAEAAAPATQLQIRTHRGRRLLQKFPPDATVAQLREFVAAAAPPPPGRDFALMTTFPTTELCDASLTLAQAGLLGAVVVQKLR